MTDNLPPSAHRPLFRIPAVDLRLADLHRGLLAIRLGERQAGLRQEVLRAVTIGELRPRSHEDVEIAGRLVRRHDDRILLLERFQIGIGIMRQCAE